MIFEKGCVWMCFELFLSQACCPPWLRLWDGEWFKQVGNVSNRHSWVSQPAGEQREMNGKGDEAQRRAPGEEGQRIYVCKSQMWAQASLAGAAGTWFGGEQEPLLTSEWFPFLRVTYQEAKWELLRPPHPTCPGICTPNSSWWKMQIHPLYGEELLSKVGVTGVPKIEELFEGCQDLSELSWELCEAFLSIGNECSFLCFSSFLPDRHWELKCPKLWKTKVVNNREQIW